MSGPVVPSNLFIVVARVTVFVQRSTLGLCSSRWDLTISNWNRVHIIQVKLLFDNNSRVSGINYIVLLRSSAICRAFMFFRLIWVYIWTIDLQHGHVTVCDLYVSVSFSHGFETRFREELMRFESPRLCHQEYGSSKVFWLCLQHLFNVFLNVCDEGGTQSLTFGMVISLDYLKVCHYGSLMLNDKEWSCKQHMEIIISLVDCSQLF